MKLAIIDIDGVVASATKRFERAGVERSLYHLAGADRPERVQREATDVYWRAALDPAFVHLDTLIDGANDHLNRLIDDGYTIVFLTSRPQAMAGATSEWFALHVFLKASTEILFKASGFQYVKTPVWKVGMAQTLIAWYGATDTIFVDDEQAHWIEAENVTCYSSLKAVFAPPVDDSDPFLPDFPE